LDRQCPAKGVGKGLPRAIQEVRHGQLVRSRAGRDRGSIYLVTKVLDERTVLVADGGARTAAAPKRKNVRHLVLHQVEAPEELCGRLSRGERVDDAEIRQAVRILEASLKGEIG
jgi:hypothetical protein